MTVMTIVVHIQKGPNLGFNDISYKSGRRLRLSK